MAGIAFLGRRDVVAAFTRGGSTIVTAGACAKDLRVVHSPDWRPEVRRVTVLAGAGGADMRRVLADRGCSIVTGSAVARNTGMVETRVCPGRSRVAVGAIAARQDVRGPLAHSRRTVVAGGTFARDLAVIEPRGSPIAGGMARTAVLGGADVRCRLSKCLHAIVT